MKRYEPEPGIYHDLPDDDYHGHWDALNASTLKNLKDRSPEYVRYLQTRAPTEEGPTPSYFALGKAVHCILGEGGDAFEERFCLRPPGHHASKAFKEAKTELEAAGKTPLKREEYDGCREIHEKAWNHTPALRELLLVASCSEASYATHDPEFDLRCKTRPDIQCAEAGTILEIKTASDATAEGFSRAASNFGYHVQRAFYMRQLEVAEPGMWHRHVFVTIANTPPWEIQLREMNQRSVDLGDREVIRLMGRYADCKATGKWYGGSGVVEGFDLPGWAFKKSEDW